MRRGLDVMALWSMFARLFVWRQLFIKVPPTRRFAQHLFLGNISLWSSFARTAPLKAQSRLRSLCPGKGFLPSLLTTAVFFWKLGGFLKFVLWYVFAWSNHWLIFFFSFRFSISVLAISKKTKTRFVRCNDYVEWQMVLVLYDQLNIEKMYFIYLYSVIIIISLKIDKDHSVVPNINS